MTSKKPGCCVFCGKQGRLSKEHIWSDWLKTILPPQKSHTYTQVFGEATQDLTDFSVTPVSQHTRQGALQQRKIRNVCTGCNSGWMSVAVNSAKPHAERLVKGEHAILDVSAQAALCVWISIAAMMAEFTDPKTAGIPSSDLMDLRATKMPLRNWYIAIGRYSGTNWHPVRYRHHGIRFVLDTFEAPAISEFGVSHCDIQMAQLSLYTIGELAVVAFSSTADRPLANFMRAMGPRSFRQLWPTASLVLDSDTLSVLTDTSLAGIEYVLGDIFR